MGVKLKTLSGEDVIAIFERFGFVAIAQTGSHVKLRRMNSHMVETLVIPSHSTISKGTLKAIFNQARRYIPSESLREHFFSAER
jgi:predicted RNA binding protein YcfA (HicA-like mRNA interferase family)